MFFFEKQKVAVVFCRKVTGKEEASQGDEGTTKTYFLSRH